VAGSRYKALALQAGSRRPPSQEPWGTPGLGASARPRAKRLRPGWPSNFWNPDQVPKPTLIRPIRWQESFDIKRLEVRARSPGHDSFQSVQSSVGAIFSQCPQRRRRLGREPSDLRLRLDSFVPFLKNSTKDLRLAAHDSKIDGEGQKETSLKVLEHIEKLHREEQDSTLPPNLVPLRRAK